MPTAPRPNRHTFTRRMNKTGGHQQTKMQVNLNRGASDTSPSSPDTSSMTSGFRRKRHLPGPKAKSRSTTKIPESEKPFYCSYDHTRSQHEDHTSCPRGELPSKWTYEEVYDGRPSRGWAYMWKSCTFLVIGLLICLLYAQTRMTQMQEKKTNMGKEELQQKMAMFPGDPAEYNIRQRFWLQRSSEAHAFRRHNLMAIGIFGSAILALIVAMILHRYRRVAQHKRKTVPFWIFSFVAVFVTVCYPVYLMKVRPPAKQVMYEVRKSPHLRFSLMLTGIIVCAIVLYSYRSYVHHQHKKHHHHHSGGKMDAKKLLEAQRARTRDSPKPLKSPPLEGPGQPTSSMAQSPSKIAYQQPGRPPSLMSQFKSRK